MRNQKIFAVLSLGSAFLWTEVAKAQEDLLARGENQFEQTCKQCHSFESGVNRIGPTLHGVIGRKAGGVESFSYSEAMTNADVTWNNETIREFIATPDEYIPGNKMPFTGTPEEPDRQAIAAYIEEQAGGD